MFLLFPSLITAIISTRSIAAAHDMIRQVLISSPERGYLSKNRLIAPDAPDKTIHVMKKNNIVFIDLYYIRQLSDPQQLQPKG